MLAVFHMPYPAENCIHLRGARTLKVQVEKPYVKCTFQNDEVFNLRTLAKRNYQIWLWTYRILRKESGADELVGLGREEEMGREVQCKWEMNGWMVCGWFALLKKNYNKKATTKVKFLSFSVFQHFSSCTQCLLNYIPTTDSNGNKGFTCFK